MNLSVKMSVAALVSVIGVTGCASPTTTTGADDILDGPSPASASHEDADADPDAIVSADERSLEEAMDSWVNAVTRDFGVPDRTRRTIGALDELDDEDRAKFAEAGIAATGTVSTSLDGSYSWSATLEIVEYEDANTLESQAELPDAGRTLEPLPADPTSWEKGKSFEIALPAYGHFRAALWRSKVNSYGVATSAIDGRFFVTVTAYGTGSPADVTRAVSHLLAAANVPTQDLATVRESPNDGATRTPTQAEGHGEQRAQTIVADQVRGQVPAWYDAFVFPGPAIASSVENETLTIVMKDRVELGDLIDFLQRQNVGAGFRVFDADPEGSPWGARVDYAATFSRGAGETEESFTVYVYLPDAVSAEYAAEEYGASGWWLDVVTY